MVILVLFEQFSGKFCLKFLTLILSALPNMMHLARTFSIKRAIGVRLMTKLLKNCIHQKHFQKWLLGESILHTPYPIPLDPPLAISYRNHQESGIFQSLGTINFVLSLPKGRVKGRGGMAQWSPLNTLLLSLYIQLHMGAVL